MKKFITLALALLISVSAAVSTSAASSDILKGSPKVDGALDDIYTQSVSIVRDKANKGYCFGGQTEPYSLDFTTYFLYDDSWFYVCTVVTDNDVIDIGADAYKTNPTEWQADAVEFKFYTDPATRAFKCHIDAYNNTMYFGDGTAAFATTDCKNAVKITDTGYVVETAYPIAEVKKLMNGDKIHVQTQVNDIAAKGVGIALYSHGNGHPLALSSNSVVIPKTETPATSPSTADSLSLAIASMAIAGAAFVVFKKRK